MAISFTSKNLDISNILYSNDSHLLARYRIRIILVANMLPEALSVLRCHRPSNVIKTFLDSHRWTN